MQYLVLKQVAEKGLATDWEPVTIASADEGELEEACRQGYTGPGRYKVIAWPECEGSEFDLETSNRPTVTPVSAETEDPA